MVAAESRCAHDGLFIVHETDDIIDDSVDDWSRKLLLLVVTVGAVSANFDGCSLTISKLTILIVCDPICDIRICSDIIYC